MVQKLFRGFGKTVLAVALVLQALATITGPENVRAGCFELMSQFDSANLCRSVFDLGKRHHVR